MDTPDKPSEAPATCNEAVAAVPPELTPVAGEITPPAAPKEIPVKLDGALGRVDGLSEAQQMEFYACEAVIQTGWSTFVQVGLAFARIRDADLYTMEFDTFEAYCREKWQYGRHYVNRLILAARVFTHLVTISHQRKPEHETQVRPLVGLTSAQAQLLRVWSGPINSRL